MVSPNIYNSRLWQTSGHWDHYAENMFRFEVEKEKFGLKPMNCPGHCLIFDHGIRFGTFFKNVEIVRSCLLICHTTIFHLPAGPGKSFRFGWQISASSTETNFPELSPVSPGSAGSNKTTLTSFAPRTRSVTMAP